MAARKNTAPATAYQPPAWLAYYTEPGIADDAKSLLKAAEAYAASMDAVLDVLSAEDAPDAGRQLALDSYHKTQDMMEFLGHWRGAQVLPQTASARTEDAEEASDAAPSPAEVPDYHGDAQEACIDLIEALRRVLRTVAAVTEEAEYGHVPNAKGLALNAARELAPRGLQILAEMEARLTEIPVDDVQAAREGAAA